MHFLKHRYLIIDLINDGILSTPKNWALKGAVLHSWAVFGDNKYTVITKGYIELINYLKGFVKERFRWLKQ